jgi:type III secretion protein J
MKSTALIGLLAAVMLTACSDQTLLQQLTEQQANDVVAVLQVHNVSAVKDYQGKAGFAINVESADFPLAVDLLRQYDLPKAPRVQIGQLFPADALVASPQAERARMLSGVEQRIEQALSILENVTTARVQLSYPLGPGSDEKRAAPMRASVLLTYRGEGNSDFLVSQVKRFVKNSLSDIEYDNIAVVLNPAPAPYRGPATSPSVAQPGAWRYWLLLLPLLMCVATAGWLKHRRRQERRSARDKQGRPERTDPADHARESAIENGTSAPGQSRPAPPTRNTEDPL